MFFLARELRKTVSELATVLTQEELTAWAGYYELKREQEDKTAERAKQQSRTVQSIRH